MEDPKIECLILEPNGAKLPMDMAPTNVEGGDRDSPTPKRVRFAASVSSNEATQLSIGTHRHPSRRECCAALSVADCGAQCLRPATSGAQVEADALQVFAPKFTYHAFGTDETIEGYEGLRVSVCFSGLDFRAWLDVHYDEKQSG